MVKNSERKTITQKLPRGKKTATPWTKMRHNSVGGKVGKPQDHKGSTLGTETNEYKNEKLAKKTKKKKQEENKKNKKKKKKGREGD